MILEHSPVGEISVGIGGGGIVGGVGVGIVDATARFSTEAPDTYPRGSLLTSSLTGVSCNFLGAMAPLDLGPCVVGACGGVGDCLIGFAPAELDAGAPSTYPKDSLDRS